MKMLRILAKNAVNIVSNVSKQHAVISHFGNVLKTSLVTTRTFTSIVTPMIFKPLPALNTYIPGLTVAIQKNFPVQEQSRAVTKFSLRTGKRKSVKAVVKRFLRLNWGGWIRTRTGRHKKLWKRTPNNKYRMRQHVLVSGSQAWLLDKCVTKYWRKPKYYVDDLYAPYHERPDFFATKDTKWIK